MDNVHIYVKKTSRNLMTILILPVINSALLGADIAQLVEQLICNLQDASPACAASTKMRRNN